MKPGQRVVPPRWPRLLRLCCFGGALLTSGAALAESRDCAPAHHDPRRSEEICIARAETKEERRARDADMCAAISHYARREGLPTGFFARLIWRESLFEPNAVSHAGAQGVAQFMPATARRRGLKDAFNPAEALGASAAYLAELRRRFGSLGLAAAAYNAGEAAVEGILAGRRSAPGETRAYVFAITGVAIDDWKDGKTRPEIDYALTAEGAATQDFIAECKALAATRRAKPMARGGSWKPWGVLIAAHRSHGTADRMFRAAQRRHGAVIRDEQPMILRRRVPGRGARPIFAAMVGRDSHSEAMRLCRRLTAAGGACVVVKN